MAYAAGDSVRLLFNDGQEVKAVIVEKIDDANIVPLKDYWRVQVVCESGLGRPFGFAAKAIRAA